MHLRSFLFISLDDKGGTEMTDIKTLEVHALPGFDDINSIQQLARGMDKLPENIIDTTPWPQYPYKPTVRFKMAYGNHTIFLKYQVKENELKINSQKNNEAVYKDSCVEFFFSIGSDRNYYNFEFNAIGTCLAAFGSDRHNRKSLSNETFHHIKTYSRIEASTINSEKSISWELTVLLPVPVFSFHQLSGFKNLKGTANFYKCGDDLNQPHYLTWNPVFSEQPDFHLREFFGNIYFI